MIAICSCNYGTEKSHNPLSASWRTRKTRGIIHSSPKAWEPGSHWCKSWSLKAWESAALMSEGKRSGTFQLKKREKEFTLCHPFVPVRPPMDGWSPPMLVRMAVLVHWVKCQFLLELSLGTHPQIMFHQLSGHPVGQWSEHTELPSEWHWSSSLSQLVNHIYVPFIHKGCLQPLDFGRPMRLKLEFV